MEGHPLWTIHFKIRDKTPYGSDKIPQVEYALQQTLIYWRAVVARRCGNT